LHPSPEGLSKHRWSDIAGGAESPGADPEVSAGHELADDVQLLDFIRRSIPSVWALELLLVLRRTPLRPWSSAELVSELRASEAVVGGVLSGLEAGGLVQSMPDGRVRFSASSELDELCDALAEAYRERPVAVLTAISAPEDRLASLANAFRWKDPPD
jgi:hypothetical protein